MHTHSASESGFMCALTSIYPNFLTQSYSGLAQVPFVQFRVRREFWKWRWGQVHSAVDALGDTECRLRNG